MIKTHFYTHGSRGPVILWGMGSFQGNETEELAGHLEKLIPGGNYTIAAFEPESWNDDFSPWKADCCRQNFGGRGTDTLFWIREEFLPEINWCFPDARKKYIAGYSLAGLFSLWALYESNLFAGAASVSGSLWFPGWKEYAENHAPAAESDVYLSLGIKEKNSRDPQMALVEENTKKQEQLLRGQARNTVLEMNPGGHFMDPQLRLAKGIAWLISRDSERTECSDR